jgi:hypothetical protein
MQQETEASRYSLPSSISKSYRRWTLSGSAGDQEIRRLHDQVVFDLIDRYEIFAKNRRQALRDWLYLALGYYFEEIATPRPTPKQFQRHLTRAINAIKVARAAIAEVGPAVVVAHKRKMGAQFAQYGLRDDLNVMDRLELSRSGTPIATSKSGRVGRKYNAAKIELTILGDDIRNFWRTGWCGGGTIDQELRATACPAAGPFLREYVQFAEYIYALVGQKHTDKAIITRLKGAELRNTLRPIEEYHAIRCKLAVQLAETLACSYRLYATAPMDVVFASVRTIEALWRDCCRYSAGSHISLSSYLSRSDRIYWPSSLKNYGSKTSSRTSGE